MFWRKTLRRLPCASPWTTTSEATPQARTIPNGACQRATGPLKRPPNKGRAGLGVQSRSRPFAFRLAPSGSRNQ